MFHLKLVIKVGGSLSFNEDGPIFSYFSKLKPVIKKISSENQLILSIGGGKFVRKYYSILKKYDFSQDEKEMIGIELLRANVRFASILMNQKPLYMLKEIDKNTTGIIGGIMPGRSTDANAAYAAAKIKADYFIKLTDVDGIYTKDPKKYGNTKKINVMSFEDLKNYGIKGKPGFYGILDKTAIDIIAKNHIKTIVMDGNEPNKIFQLFRGKKMGTLIAD